MRPGTALLPLLAALTVGGCLSLGGPPLEPRYFTATPFVLDAERPAAPETVAVLFMGLSAAEHLRERFVWSDGSGEVGFREELRWAEAPSTMVGRAFGRLRDRGEPDAAATTVLVGGDLLAFEERWSDGGSAALVELDARFTTRAGAFLGTERVRVERPLDGDDPARLAEELGLAAAEAARRVVARAEELAPATDA
jgi:ABC-type uncharacterized transport system auxiliary subunit